jgi:hypothetical protein
MGDITVHFDGICTQLSKPIPPELGIAAKHRTVLVHAEQGRVLAGKGIPPHYPVLEVPFADLVGALDFPSMTHKGGSVIWQLDGVRLRIGNAVQGDVDYDDTYKNVPRLREHNHDLQPLKKDVVAGGGAAAYFDADAGTFSSEMIHHGAWRSILDVETDGDPLLLITPLDGGPEQRLQLRSGAMITIANTGEGMIKESPFDFFLHYLVTESVPPSPYYPPPAARDGGDVLGPGCSNSNYP